MRSPLGLTDGFPGPVAGRDRMRPFCRLLPMILIAGLFAGCALLRPAGSWVELASAADAEPLSEAIVVFVAESLNEPGATIVLASLPEDQASNPLTLRVREKLLARGYQFDETGSVHRDLLSYVVSRYADRILLRVTFRQTEVSVLFARDGSGALRASAPLARREKAKVL
jgi:hypothetical protein